ncbi:MAG: Zn-dependent hydrolase [Burkholderiales bacterium]
MIENSYDAAVAAVSQERLWQRHMELARIGGLPAGGVKRLALTEEDMLAQRVLLHWAGDRGYKCWRDEIGNIFVRRDGSDSEAAPIMTGSHLDTQPTGGKFDGAYGVLAGFEVLEAFDDAGVTTRRPVEVVAWMNEEGSRFVPGAMGSAVFAGTAALADMLARTDPAGISVSAALAQTAEACPIAARALGSVRPAAYVEAHIEQGPRLEGEGATIGVVLGIQGIRRFSVEVIGEEAHAGTTPRRHRKDAVSAATAAIAALEHLTADNEDAIRFTVGRMEVFPNSPNTIPGRVTFSIDLRHPDEDLLTRLGERIHEVACDAVATRRCTATVVNISFVKPTTFAPKVVDLVRRMANELGIRNLDLPSGAGHDAMHLSRACPTGMIFVPCLHGVSHNEAESATPEDLAAGTRVLARVVLQMANE